MLGWSSSLCFANFLKFLISDLSLPTSEKNNFFATIIPNSVSYLETAKNLATLS